MAGLRRFRAADLGDFKERGVALGEIAEQLERLLESRLGNEPRWVDAGAVSDGFVIGLLAERSPDVEFQGMLWVLGGNHSWALPVAGTFTLAPDEASLVSVELTAGDATVGLEPVADEPGSRPAEWVFRFAWP